jgi:Ca2+-transporting ATPase
VWGALALCLGLLLLAVYVPVLAEALSLADPGAVGWSLATGFSLLPLLVGQALFLPRTRRLLLGGAATNATESSP